MGTTIHVCVTCRAGQQASEPPLGALLYGLLRDTSLPKKITIAQIKCLSACHSGVVVSLSSPGRWTYVYGRLALKDLAALASGATAYASSADGIVPWRERPEIFKRGTVARIPPQKCIDE
ncbi:MAG: DUF1636 domain-containing protein [Myxococcales bacterium]|nr:DUF1636 domain-containing protein [Myxococcales bacterium]